MRHLCDIDREEVVKLLPSCFCVDIIFRVEVYILMVDVTFAIRAANNYFQKIDQALSGSSPENLRLEEVEKTEDKRH